MGPEIGGDCGVSQRLHKWIWSEVLTLLSSSPIGVAFLLPFCSLISRAKLIVEWMSIRPELLVLHFRGLHINVNYLLPLSIKRALQSELREWGPMIGLFRLGYPMDW